MTDCLLCGYKLGAKPPGWKEDVFARTFYQCWNHKASMPIIANGKQLTDKAGFQAVIAKMVEYSGEDKPWAWVIKDILNPKVTREAKPMEDKSIKCPECGGQAGMVGRMGDDIEIYRCGCGKFEKELKIKPEVAKPEKEEKQRRGY